MPRLQLKSITCLKKQDLVGKDKPIIKLDGVEVWAGTGFKKDTTRTLENVEPRRFTNQIKLELLEFDARSKNELLGEKVIDDRPQNFGVREVSFVERGAHYKVTYEVR